MNSIASEAHFRQRVIKYSQKHGGTAAMYNLADGRKQLAKYNVKSNNIPKICLNFKSPNQVLSDYLSILF